MSTQIPIEGWFREEPVPVLTPTPAVLVGGTPLLKDFFGRVAGNRVGGHLAIASPFVGRSIRYDLPAWEEMPHDLVDLHVVTNASGDAQTALDALGGFAWKSLLIQTRPRLHAKIYSFVPSLRGGICLVGSHNLSRGGALANLEAGVLFVSSNQVDFRFVSEICRGRIVDLGMSGRIFFDSLAWPEKPAA